jgi:hypothetical protein
VKTVDIFRSMGDQMLDDPRVQRYGMILLRAGVEGLRKADPVMVWIDVGISVCDACSSYLKYAARVEINKQIEIENDLLKAHIEAQLKKLGLELARQQAIREGRRQAIALRIKENAHERARILKAIGQHSDSIFRIHRMVCEVRMQGYSAELEHLQMTLDLLVGVSLECLTETVN